MLFYDERFDLKLFHCLFLSQKTWLVCLPTCLLTFFEGLGRYLPRVLDAPFAPVHATTGDSQKKNANQFDFFLFK